MSVSTDLVSVGPTDLARWDPLETILAGSCTPSTIAKYRVSLRLYRAFCDERRLDPLDVKSFAAWRDTMALDTELSPNTINFRLAGVRKVMAVGAEKDYLPPATAQAFTLTRGVKARALRDRLKPNARTRISQADMRRLCNHPDPATLIGLRDRALLLTMATSGARISEVVHLKQTDIHRRDKGWIVQVLGKTDVTPRDAPLGAEAHRAIQTWLERRGIETDIIFTSFAGRGQRPTAKRMDVSSAWRIVSGHAKELGITDIKPHDFRRFVGTQLAKDNARHAQKALGHKSLSTTMDNYVLDDLPDGLTDNLF